MSATETAAPVAATLLALLDNQIARTRVAIGGISQAAFDAEQPGGCNTVRAIGAHLIDLRRFQLGMLGSARRESVADRGTGDTPEHMLAALESAGEEVRAAIVEHDPEDWFRVPETPREGKWGDEPTIHRFGRPFNDFVNHLGAIRVIRRQMGEGIERTQ